MTSNITITKTFVDSTKTSGLYWDKNMKGFGLCVSGQTKSYIVQARVNGANKRITFGRHGLLTAEEARKRARAMLVQMADGIDLKEKEKAQRDSLITLQELFDAYLTRRTLKERTIQDYKSYLKRYFSDWSRKAAKSITLDMVEARYLLLIEKHGSAQANVSMRCLRAIYNYAMGVYTIPSTGEPLIVSNPVKRLSAKKLWIPTNARETYIREGRFNEWFHSTINLGNLKPGSHEDTVRDYLLFIAFTGLRKTEASLIRWEHVDLEGKQVMLPRENTKNGTNFHFPLTSFTFQILKTRAAYATSEFVFPGSGTSGHLIESRYVMKKVMETSGVKFSLHDLRRTFATYAAYVVDNNFTIKRLMNHLTNQDLTQRYIQGVEQLRAPAQNITDYMLSLAKLEDYWTKA